MAKATSKTEVTNVTLELDKPEAEMLVVLLGHVSGGPNGPAKQAGSIVTALKDFNTANNPVWDLAKTPTYGGAGVRFMDYKSDKGNS